jgi:hypothetical protein
MASGRTNSVSFIGFHLVSRQQTVGPRFGVFQDTAAYPETKNLID